ncbi:MAG: Ycf51 family protein [Thermosynechococcaceae cyanobacterium]
MPSPENFLTYTLWSGIALLICAALSVLAFVLGWGMRFRLVGATGFMGILTFGLFALSLSPLSQTVVSGSTKYSLVYDSGAGEAVISVAPTITEEQLEATLQQAGLNLFSPGRLGRSNNQLTVRARTVIHPEAGISIPLYLGQVQRSLAVRDDPNQTVTLFEQNLARLPGQSEGPG